MYSLKASERVLYGENYLVISLEGRNLIAYQEDMLYENRLPGYLGFYSKFENETLIFYNITNCVRLSDFIGSRKLSRRQYLMVVDAIVDAMILRDQYFLSENSLLIHQDFIFIKDNSEITLVYLPAEINLDSKLALKEFVVWLTSRLDVSEPGAADASIPLQLMLNSPSFNLKVVKETIAQILASAPQESVPRARDTIPPSPPVSINPIEIPEPPSKEPPLRRKNNAKELKDNKKQENLFGIGIKKKKIEANKEKQPGRKVKRQPARDGYANAAIPAKQGPRPDRPQAAPNKEDAYPDKPIRNEKPEEQVYERSSDYPKSYGVGISEDIQFLVYLIYKPNTSEEQIIHVDKSPFSIGRGENADYLIAEISVSREHAQITIEQGNVYLTDTMSKYGTYVNDIRLQPNKPALLKDDDSVKFSGLAYSVKIVQMNDLYNMPR